MEQQMTGRTQSMTGRTTSLTGTRPQPARATLAARSLAAVDRITDTSQRRAAFAAHMERFPSAIAR